jgi:hypothetical protein
MRYHLFVAGALFFLGCGHRLATPVSARTSASPAETFDCVKKQMADLGYKQTSIDVDAHRISGVKIDMTSRRPDTQFRRILNKLDVEVVAQADGGTSLDIQPHTFAEYTTQRGPTEVEEKASEEASTAAEQLLDRCRS